METFPLKLKSKKICRANAMNKNAFFFFFFFFFFLVRRLNLDCRKFPRRESRSPADQIKVSTARDATVKDESRASLSRKI